MEEADTIVLNKVDLLTEEEANRLLAAIGDTVDQLSRLVREHPDGETYAIQADVVELQREARTLAADTELQKAAVGLDTIGVLLDLLVREARPDGSFESTLDSVRRQRQTALLDAPDVLYEMRECAYYNLVLWDLLCQARQ